MKRDFLYIKINPKVSEWLGQSRFRARTADGNHMAFIQDIKRIDRDFLAHPEETASAIGAVLLNRNEAYEEQRGTVVRPLPAATDPRFTMEIPEEVEPSEVSEASESSETSDNSESSEISEDSEDSELSETSEEGGES